MVYGLKNEREWFSDITIHIKTPLAVGNTAKGVLSYLRIKFAVYDFDLKEIEMWSIG